MRVILIILAAALIPVCGQAPGKRENKQNPATGNQTSGKPITGYGAELTANSGIAPGHKDEGKTKGNSAKEKPSYWEEAFGPASLPNWALVVVGGIASFLAWSTLKTIKDQASSGRDAANAALLNAQAVINSERPWISISVESPEPNKFVYKATNVGRTPANITVIWSTPLAITRGQKLQLVDDFDKTECLFTYPPRLLPPAESCVIGRCNIEQFRPAPSDSLEAWLARIANGTAFVYFYGKGSEEQT